MPDRPPFDPSKIAAAPPSAPEPDQSSGPALLSVRQVTAMVRAALAQKLPPKLHVVGEIGDLSRPDSGHIYFTLKDDYSELRCVMWRSSAARLKFRPEPGLDVVASGAIEVYEPRGTYQLIATRLEPRGVGALELAFRQLREKLEREGLFDPRRKKPLPAIAFRIALVTSPSGAAVRDLIHAIRRRFPAADVLLYPVRVQGDGAAAEIAAAIEALNRHSESLGGIDVLIVGRGGGSLEDLWAFNEEVVARAVAASRIPVVSAVGHEVDFTICDFVADVRAATPTAAAELTTPVLAELIAALDRDAARVGRVAGHGREIARSRLGAVMATEFIARPIHQVRQAQQRLDDAGRRLRLALIEALRRRRERLARGELAAVRLAGSERFARIARRIETAAHHARLALLERFRGLERRLTLQLARVERRGPEVLAVHAEERVKRARMRLDAAVRHLLTLRTGQLGRTAAALAACDPKSVLARGYSITREARTRRVLKSVSEIRDGQRIATELSDGEFRSTADDPRQPGLFE